MSRLALLGMMTWAMVSPAVFGQYPNPNIPPTRVPQTDEPPYADPKKAGDLPDRFKRLPTDGGSAVRPAGPNLPNTPVSVDPPPPVVTLHIDAPASLSAGADVEYKILVENKSQASAYHVKVFNPIPDGAGLHRADPTPDEATAKLLVWKLGHMKPGEKKTITLILRPLKDGMEAIENTARVTFEHGQKVRTILQRPQLSIQKLSHQHALENQAFDCKLIVENTGAVEILNIDVNEVLSEGLAFHEKGLVAGQTKKWNIKSLQPKQKQEYVYSVMGTKTGELTSRIEAVGERGAKATNNWKIHIGPSPLSVKINGPKQVYLNYPATYQIQVNYNGLVPLDNVVVAFSLAKGMKVIRATPGSADFKDRLQWAIPRLNPREPRTFAVSVQMASAGTVPSFVQVLWRGPEQRDEISTEFLGATALHVDVKESNDPVRVGEKVRYTITVSNNGTMAAKNVRVTASYPLTQFSLDPDGSDGRRLENGVQEIIVEVPAKGKVFKTVTLKAAAAGKAVFHVEMASSDLTAGNVTREEPTTITE